VHLLKPCGFLYLCGNRRHFSASGDVTLFHVQPHTYERVAERVVQRCASGKRFVRRRKAVNPLRRSRKNSNQECSRFDTEILSTLAGCDAKPDSPPHLKDPENRLDSWKEIAVYLDREVRTVQRWEKREHLPVHRHLHRKMGSIFAFKHEIDSWRDSRSLSPVPSVSQKVMTELVAGAPLVFSEHSGPKEQTPMARLPRTPSWAWESVDSIPAIIYFRSDTTASPPHAGPPRYRAVVGVPSHRKSGMNFTTKRMAAKS
jgi:hypothetical protein